MSSIPLLISTDLTVISNPCGATLILKGNIEEKELITTFEKITKDHDTLIATLIRGISSTEINKYLFDNGFVLSHLVKRKPSLEQQFLDLTNNN